jgi:hypothetical protein
MVLSRTPTLSIASNVCPTVLSIQTQISARTMPAPSYFPSPTTAKGAQ